MKKFFLNLFWFVLFISVQTVQLNAQGTEIPVTVTDAFHRMYPNVVDADVYWEVEEEEYTATFEDEKMASVIATFDDGGAWIQSTIEVEFEDLPLIAQQLIQKEYKVEMYYNLTKLEVPFQVTYNVNFETKKDAVYLVFDKIGKLIDREIEGL
ncbi:MAG: hypothetical protein AAGJ18_27030 [Bacteroidota bacterium]